MTNIVENLKKGRRTYLLKKVSLLFSNLMEGKYDEAVNYRNFRVFKTKRRN